MYCITASLVLAPSHGLLTQSVFSVLSEPIDSFFDAINLGFLIGATEIGGILIDLSETMQTNMPLHGINVTLLLFLLLITTKYSYQVSIFGVFNQFGCIYENLPQTSNSLLVWYQICAQVTLSTLIHTPNDTGTWTM
jgi:hypothetical protein